MATSSLWRAAGGRSRASIDGAGDPAARFRDGQDDAIRRCVSGAGRQLVVQKTGWGKSFVYFIACKLLREQGGGPAIVVSPLLALMRNQLVAAERMGVRAAAVHSDNRATWPEIAARVRVDEVDVLLISPERLANEEFGQEILAPIADRVALLVVDEAHCISDWGHDFRPHYRLIERVLRTFPANLRVLATTATANRRVMDDLQRILGPALHVSRGDLNRPSLTLQVIPLQRAEERLAWLADTLPRLAGSGIVYTLTVRDAHRVAAWLRSRGVDVAAYTGEGGDVRPELEQALLDNRVKALVATTALGMGFDKPDLGFVIHYQAPGSVVAYYQQVGRAGRALDAAYGILLCGREDDAIHDYFVRSAFPTRTEVAAVLEALGAARNGLTRPELLPLVNATQGRIDKTLELLALESPAPLVKERGKWTLTAAHLAESFWERVERLTKLRREERAQMREYAALTSGHMKFLIRALDGDPAPVAAPRLAPLPVQVDEATARDAAEFLRGAVLRIAPRKLWPPGGLPRWGVQGRIPAERQSSEGRALCQWGDAGWGRSVERGKHEDGQFSDELVAAAASLIRAWAPTPAPLWVTCVPSHRHVDLVPSFARRLAAALELPFHAALIALGNRAEQKSMANSAQQGRNVDGAMAVVDGMVLPGAVLLVDDVVDSRWTLTAAAWLLRGSGCGEVHPFALAVAGSAE